MRNSMLGLLLLLMLLSAVPSRAQSLPHVVVVNSYHKEFFWVHECTEALEAQLQGRADLEFLYMDAKRLPESEYGKRAEQAFDVIRNSKPQLVLLADDLALKMLGQRVCDLGIPVVYYGINSNPRGYFSDMTLATGVLERPMVKRSLALLARAFEQRFAKVLILFDDSLTATAIYETQFGGSPKAVVNGMNVEFRRVGQWSDWQAMVPRLAEEGFQAVFLGLYQHIADGKGGYVDSEEAVRWTCDNTPVPPFGFWDFNIGEGLAVGGVVLTGRQQGQAAGEIALKVLQGTKPSEIYPQTDFLGHHYFSRSGLQKWRLQLTLEADNKATLVP